MNKSFEATGGARLGWMNASWPFAKLKATPEAIHLSVRLLGDYTFPANRVVAITRFTRIPVLGWGIQIQHNIADYPDKVIFWCLGSPDALLAGIHEAGFLSKAPASADPPRTGMPFRWPPVIIAVLVWNALLGLDMGFFIKRDSPVPGPLSLLAVGLVFIATLATLRAPSFQRFILKPGRSVGEIRPILYLSLLISGGMGVMLTIFMVAHYTH